MEFFQAFLIKADLPAVHHTGQILPVIVIIMKIQHAVPLRQLLFSYGKKSIVIAALHAQVHVIIPRDKSSMAHRTQQRSPLCKILYIVLFAHLFDIF